jgi:hypothetical protein
LFVSGVAAKIAATLIIVLSPEASPLTLKTENQKGPERCSGLLKILFFHYLIEPEKIPLMWKRNRKY